MKYQISGKQIDIGDALKVHAQEQIGALAQKYAGRPTGAVVIFSRDGHAFAAEAEIHLSTGLNAQASAKDNEIYAAFDKCVDKLETQLRRYKRRLKDHHKERVQPVEHGGGAAYILASSSAAEAEEPETLQPMIIAEMETKIPELTVGEAVMQMELRGAPVLVFRNEKQDRGVNIVYRRDDGNIGWIDPH
ncbi:MAG: ribosome-associated translation inhibitor RaiA [Pseudomonadota bacterium]